MGREGACSTMMQAREQEGDGNRSVNDEYRCYKGLQDLKAVSFYQSIFPEESQKCLMQCSRCFFAL